MGKEKPETKDVLVADNVADANAEGSSKDERDSSETPVVADESTKTQKKDKKETKPAESSSKKEVKEEKPAEIVANDEDIAVPKNVEEVKVEVEKSNDTEGIKSNKESKKVENDSAQKSIETVEDVIDEHECYPFRIRLMAPTTVYRGASEIFAGRQVGGFIEIIGPTDENSFTPVSYVRSGFGRTTGYIRLTSEVISQCRL